jgi:AcrR family transcriptional regulator
MTSRGSYAKGVAKRQEILKSALRVVADQGYRNASVREIAEAAGLSPAGMMHYFGTKEDLFVAILEARDQQDGIAHDGGAFIERFLDVMRHNASVPGLVHLYSQLAAEAGDPKHPAHDFFRRRTDVVHKAGRAAVVAAQEDGTIRADLDPDWILRATHAIADGLQTAWLLNNDVDMAADIEQFIQLLRPAAKDASV